MRITIKTVCCILVTLAMLLPSFAGLTSGVSFAAVPTLFKTSFESGEEEISGEILGSEGVIKTLYGIKGKGLAVRLETVKGTDDYLGSENKYNLFDGRTATKYLTANRTCFVSFALGEPAAVNAYEIASANDEQKRDPKSWTLYGSNDGSSWTALDSRSNAAFTGRFQTKKFTFNNSVPYEWYKLEVTENCGGSMIQFSSLDLYCEESSGEAGSVDEIVVDTSTVTATEANGSSQSPLKLFDGSADTKYLTAKDNSSCFVSFALTEPAIIKSYTVTSANDAYQRDPRDWTLYGSSDGIEWTALDVRTGVAFADRKSPKTFSVSNNASYLWYKFDVTANNGTDAYGYVMVQFSELTLSASHAEESGEAIPSEVVSSSVTGTEGYSGHPADYAFDGNVSTKYLVGNSQTASLVFKLSSSQVITHYTLSNGDDHLERDPKDWKFYGSSDGSSWTLLDERSDESFSGAKSTNAYKITNGTSYLWYKLEILSPVGPDTWFSSGGEDVYFIHLSELQLFTEENWRDPPESEEEQIDENGPFSVVLGSVKGSATVSTDEGKEKLFDRDEATKACFTGKTVWVSFRVNRADTVTAYSVTSANDWANRDPEDWTLYGSADGEVWTAIDVREGVVFQSRYEEKVFRLDTPVSYLYYKFDVTKNGGNTSYTQFSNLTLMTAEEVLEAVPGMTAEKNFGPTQTDTGKPGAFTGTGCLAVYGEQERTENTSARIALFKGLNIPVSADTTMSYLVFPGLFNIKSYDYEYTSCRVIIDLHFTDGTLLSALGAKDQNGSVLSPEGQVEGECLYTMQWNYIECRIGEVASGKRIDRIDVYFDMENAEDASKFITFFDDLKIENKEPIVYEHLSDYITILRGTNNDSAFSRGLCTPAVTLPNGFNFYSPVTNPAKPTASYNYQQNGDNNPLDSITVIHAPSYWLSSYGTWQFMPVTTVNAASEVTASAISSEARRSKFSHDNEIARAHYYSVVLDEGTPASGVKIEVTPTSHAAYVRITFPSGAANASVIFDSIWGSGTLSFGSDNKSFTATTSHNSAGSVKMYVTGEFDRTFSSSAAADSKSGVVTFPNGTRTVTMKIATSFISLDQAKHNMALEIGNKTFDGVLASAQQQWDALCGKFEIEGATYTELVNFYSSLYRMYCYPNLMSENEGTNENPVWVYASPYRSGAKTSGIFYTNNGFWDTYRTTWAGYSLFTADKDGEMLDGIVQHYIDSGWIPRWICPGGANVMVGTSSDVIFADAYIKGVNFNYEKAWESMIENAGAYSATLKNGGRPDNDLTPFLGYVANTTGEGYSSSIESYINDYGLYRMAEKMGLTAEADYYLNRCLKYPELFNAEAGFFMGKNAEGVFSATAENYDPAAWGGPKGDYTESVGWVNTFPAVFDGEGMVTLYGSREALAEKLNTMFDDSPASMRKVVTGTGHEICEFKEVKMGQYEHNNQPSHHVIYTYAFSSEPYRIQEYTREVLRHVYVGSEIGQGFPGDEDNGEMSAWYVFNALGFYPYCLASGEYVIGSPLFDKVTVHLDNGNDIVIVAKNNSDKNVYIQSAKVNGQPYNKLTLSHETLTNGCVIEYTMGDEPSSFGAAESARPSSLSARGSVKAYEKDLSDSATLVTSAFDGTVSATGKVYTDITRAARLFDGNSRSYTTIADGSSIVFTAGTDTDLTTITLSSYDAASAPTGFKLEVSNDGAHWGTLLEEEGISFLFDRFVVPFALPHSACEKFIFYRITFYGGTKLSEVEFIGAESALSIGDVSTLLDYLASDDANNGEMPVGKAYVEDVTSTVVSIMDVSILLNKLSGN